MYILLKPPWQQAQLNLSRGLGLRALTHHSSLAYIASLPSTSYGAHKPPSSKPPSSKPPSSKPPTPKPPSYKPLSPKPHLPSHETFNTLIAPGNGLETPSCVPLPQKELSFSLLFHSSLASDRACLLSISSSHAASWLSAIPSNGLGLHLVSS